MLCKNKYNKYFKLLNIDVATSDKNIIKKAYRQLSIRYHPDKNNGKTNDFNNISDAYRIITEAIDNNDLFDDNTYLHTDNINSSMQHSSIHNPSIHNSSIHNSSMQKYSNILTEYKFNYEMNIYTADIEVKLNISYEQSYYGSSSPIEIERLINNYNNVSREYEKIYIKIPKSCDNNEIIIVQNKGNCYNHKYSNVKITIKLIDNNVFKRDGLDLIYVKDITLKEALTGINFNFKHLNGKIYVIKNNREIINSNTKMLIRNTGFERDDIKGNLIIQFNIEFPKKLAHEVIEKLRELL